MAKKTNLQKLKDELYRVSHTYIRQRDSLNDYEIAGNCFDCGRYAFGGNFQAGHFIPDASGGAVLRYHPQNMHGQAGGCNMKFQQETVKINYTFAMLKKYGKKRVEQLRKLKNKVVKADEIFYQTLIDLYKKKDEKAIIKYLESL
jgi:hypothetical protein